MNDPFHLEGDARISLREKIFRELVSNIIAHREYADARPATIMIYKDRVEFKNPNHANGKGPINPNSFVPRPKNPVISRFMIQLGRAEELGSGITNVTKYLPFYTKGGEAIFIEDSMFTTVIPLIPATKANYVKETPGKTPGKILSLLKENPNLTIPELAEKTGKSESAVERSVRKLRESKHLKRIGPDKGGHWQVMEK